MSDMSLLPVGSGFGSDAMAAGFGGFVGSIFGDWFGGGNGWGRGGVAPAVGAVANGLGETVILNDLDNLHNSVNGLGLAVVQGQNTSNLAIAQGFGGMAMEVANASATNTAAVNNAAFGIQSTLCQGFSGVNQSVYQAGVDTRFAINDLARQNAECCCQVKGAIMAEGAATRQLIQNNLITELQTELCDSKSKISQLETQNYLNASQNAQTQQIINTVLAHLPLTTTPKA